MNDKGINKILFEACWKLGVSCGGEANARALWILSQKDEATAKDMIKEFMEWGYSKHSLSICLTRLRRAGFIERVRRGLYRAVLKQILFQAWTLADERRI